MKNYILVIVGLLSFSALSQQEENGRNNTAVGKSDLKSESNVPPVNHYEQRHSAPQEYPKTYRLSQRSSGEIQLTEPLTKEQRIEKLTSEISSIESKIAYLESEQDPSNNTEIAEKNELLLSRKAELAELQNN